MKQIAAGLMIWVMAFSWACAWSQDAVEAESQPEGTAQAEPAEVAGLPAEGPEVGEIRIEGLERVSDQLVRSKLEVQAGKPFNPRAVARDIRRLYDMGFFDQIEVDAEEAAGKINVIYAVAEKRLIDEIRIIGNGRVRARAIREVLSWKEGEAFVADGYDDERAAVVKLFQSKGYPNAKVDIIADELGPGRVRITYSIDTGHKARISSIKFDGNDALSTRKLRKIMKTRRSWWFLGGKFDEAKLENDLKNILTEYGNVGHLEAEVEGTELNYSENGKHLDLMVHLKEGAEYTVESMDVADNEVYDDDELMTGVKVQAGDVHNKTQVAKDASALQKGYEGSGYVNAQVAPQVTLDREKKTTHVVHEVQEGNLKYIREVKISGNDVTKDEVVRRSLMTAPGERFDGQALESSKQQLENTGYFDEVRTTLEDVEGSDLFTNVLVDVDEGKTGNFNFGAGYSSEEKFGVYGELKLNNFDLWNWPKFSGAGQQFSVSVRTGEIRDQYSLSFTDPEIAGLPLAFGFDLFDEAYVYEGGVSYTESNRGGQLRLGKVLSPYVKVTTALRYDEADITDLPYYLSPQLQLQRGGTTTISDMWAITRDTRDSVRDPSKGARHDLATTLAGLGGDNNFWRVEHDSTWFHALDEESKWIISFRTREGWVDDYGNSKNVPLSERYFAGGTSTIRGYDTRDVGPKARRPIFFGGLMGKSDAIGGELRILNSAELKYKLTDKIRLYGFVDSGGVWETASDFDFGDTKYSAGLGFGVNVPRLGPIRLDYGIPLNPDDDQGNGRLHLISSMKF